MADLLGLSADVIDGRIELERAGPLNRINHELSELSSGIAVVEAFSHCVVFKTDDGLVCFDTSNEHGGHKCCLLYTSPSPRDQRGSRMPSSA